MQSRNFEWRRPVSTSAFCLIASFVDGPPFGAGLGEVKTVAWSSAGGLIRLPIRSFCEFVCGHGHEVAGRLLCR